MQFFPLPIATLKQKAVTKVLTVVLGLSTITAVTAPAITIRVPEDFQFIQEAIQAAHNGDLILVSQGVYVENINFLGKAITVSSVNGPSETIIDGGQSDSVVKFLGPEGPQSILSGFTIQNGRATFGGGMRLTFSSPTIIGNIFRKNGPASGTGAAIDGNSASPRIEGNLFFANSCDTQHEAAVITFANFSSPLIINNVLVKNQCRAIVMSLPQGFSPVVANNTIVLNRDGIKIYANNPASTQLYANNILIRNGVGVEFYALVPGNEPTWTHNLVYLNSTNYLGVADQTGVNGNISMDPLFRPIQPSFQLHQSSPALDAGVSLPWLPSVDFLGHPRVLDGDENGSALPDIGACEFIPLSRWRHASPFDFRQ